MVLVLGHGIDKWNGREIAEAISHTQAHLLDDKGSITDYRKIFTSAVKVLNQLVVMWEKIISPLPHITYKHQSQIN